MRILSYTVETHIVRNTGNGIEFLLLKRSETEIYPGIWQMVTGSIAQDEKAYVTAYREVIEETGITPLKMWIVPVVNSFYSWKRNHICLVPVFAVLVNSDLPVVLSEEHSDYVWTGPDEAKPMLAWQGQRNSIDVIREHFTGNSFLNFEEIDLKRIKLSQIKK